MSKHTLPKYLKPCLLGLLLPMATMATNALRFDGADDYVSTPITSAALTNTFTIEAWVSPSQLNDDPIFSTLDGTNLKGIELHLKTNGVVCFTARTKDGWVDASSMEGVISENAWSHIAVTSDGTNVNVLVNGESVATGTIPEFEGGSSPLLIGRRMGEALYYQGDLAELQIWNKVRSLAEIQTDLGGYSAAQTNQVAYYKLHQGIAGGDNTGITTVTSLGNAAYDGTLEQSALTGATSNWVYWSQSLAKPSGEGTQNSPYLIDSLPNLNWLSKQPSAWSSHFRQMRDIDAEETSQWDNGAGFTPIATSANSFSGIYHGQKNRIQGLTIKQAKDYVGLFGNLGSSAVVDSLSVTGTIEGNKIVGGLAGNSTGRINGCSFSGLVTGKNQGGDGGVGGLVGRFGYGACAYIEGSFFSGSVDGSNTVGGIAGWASCGNVTTSYSVGSVKSETGVQGGVIGEFDNGSITQSYTAAKILGSAVSDKGAFVGYCGTAIDSTNYWNQDSANIAGCGRNSISATGLTTSDMRKSETFTGWSFVGPTAAGALNTWDIDPSKNNGFPFFSWQYPRLSVDMASAKTNRYTGSKVFVLEQEVDPDNGDQVIVRSTLTFDDANVGTAKTAHWTFSLSGTDADSYVAPFGYSIQDAEIQAVPLVITAPSLTYTLGDALPTTFDFTFSGFVNGEDATVLTGLGATLSCGECKTAGTFDIVPSASAANYALSFVNGVLTLNAVNSTRLGQGMTRMLDMSKVRRFDLLGRFRDELNQE